MNFLAKLPAEPGWRAIVSHLHADQETRIVTIEAVQMWGLVYVGIPKFDPWPGGKHTNVSPIAPGIFHDSPGFKVLALIEPTDLRSDHELKEIFIDTYRVGGQKVRG